MGMKLAMPHHTAEVAIAFDVETVKHLIGRSRRCLSTAVHLPRIIEGSHSALPLVFVLRLLLSINSAASRRLSVHVLRYLRHDPDRVS